MSETETVPRLSPFSNLRKDAFSILELARSRKRSQVCKKWTIAPITSFPANRFFSAPVLAHRAVL
ncbi:hypothetical protein C0Q70_14724 [Pomacea canaliculata]|uniref:Uncharacterized protein n=1 Tax=Pomacea canaliculata TaxID=400727 RepID=A0A2T7NSX8_POMCA|nr:hypothetical protein C0Q70_14724 [Pomacea canaliculata]